MAVPVTAGPTLETGSPEFLFQTRFPGAIFGGIEEYVPSADGQRFLMNVAVEESAAPITVVLNWFEEPKQRVPTGQ